ncbi:type ISP restriction/modification enzyme [Bosea vaviloviae]|uniref:site-specific DNA-methyltransferase (adenine-specific) n=1 Tax=Bosea vaviloviae TaxID=1526658 RepID=A0A0N1N2Q0_9HYPH|nr:type ISP restriction/modification enzyme [Bosea vaviloviae]KPH82148.1 hypothetical protein AE618_04305 [Bosea vaviloviae]
MTTINLLQAYARRIRDLRRANADVPETGLAPAFQTLLQALTAGPLAGQGLTVVPEFNNPGFGRPDIALMRAGSPARAFVELKSLSKPADPTRWRDNDRRQFVLAQELASWASCNFHEIRLFARGEEVALASVVPEAALRPDRDDARADRLIAQHDSAPLIRLVERLCLSAGQEPTARDAPHLAKLLAHSARLVRGIVQDRLSELRRLGVDQHALLDVRRVFRDELYAHPEAGGYPEADFDVLFSAAFAQTLAFGLLLVREARNEPVGADAWRHMPGEHPLMQTALRLLSFDEVVAEIGVGFDAMRDTINSFTPDILAVGADGRDPILYFYENFLETFDPDARERFGVYYTPIEVVRFMCGALDCALKERLAPRGLRDEAVTILDPATGTGTFLLGLAERVWSQAAASDGPGMAALELRNLAGRLFGFELLVGPYAVAHYRLHHALQRPAGPGEAPRPALQLPRLGVYLADTLSRPGADAAAGHLGFVGEGIAEERREANRIKAAQPIMAIIGNPPYRRLEEGENRTLVGDWMDGLWDDLKRPVRDAGQGGQLNTFPEFSVAFWRWALWKLFDSDDAPQRGVVAFITNRKFLTGWPYAGLRQMMRRRFDRIEIIDLRGDVRRGERAGVEDDQGVFNIQVGTAITIAIADGSKAEGALAEVRYLDSWAEGRFSRRAKLEWLENAAAVGRLANDVSVERPELDDFRPEPFMNGEWVSLSELFGFQRSGVQTKRDSFAYATSRQLLRERIDTLRRIPDEQAANLFHPTAARTLASARARDFEDRHAIRSAYRPFDVRWLYNDFAFIDRPRPELQAVWGQQNLALYALPGGVGSGPAVWCHGLLPDYHAFRGSYGGYAFPLHDRRPESAGTNLSPALLAGLAAAYGAAVTPEATFDAILGLLSATSYTLRFAEDLEDVFPHVPFPAARATFDEAGRIGAEIRALETFVRAPAARPPGFTRVDSEPRGPVAPVAYVDGAITLCADGSGRISGIPWEVWEFSVSGYRVLPRWIDGRQGLPADLALVRELRDICGRIAELIELFAGADTVLADAIANPLSREALGL